MTIMEPLSKRKLPAAFRGGAAFIYIDDFSVSFVWKIRNMVFF
jgi:hypothetical protein